MKTSLVFLLLVVILVHVGTSFPTERKGSQTSRAHASWDDVNVVAHGLLQLGQGLKEHVDKSKAQMRDINAKLLSLNGSLAELKNMKNQKPGEFVRSRTGEVEERERLEAELSTEVRAKLEEVMAERQSLLSRMGSLEEKVNRVLREPEMVSNSSDNGQASLIQNLLEVQNRRIDDLVERIKQQQGKLEKQGLHLQALQTKVAQRRVKSHRRRDENMALRGDAENGSLPGLARDCHGVFGQGQLASGVYTVQPENSDPFDVLCEMTLDSGWTVIQKRYDGSQNFNQLWECYQKGFGDLNGEFWLGLEKIHSLSKQGLYTLRVELSDWTGEERLAEYQFRLDGQEKNFALHLEQSSSSGVQDDTMTTREASGTPFSTSDRDNDLSSEVNCAGLLSGGWWFSGCGDSNLNGRYPRRHLRRRSSPQQQMFWATMSGHKSSLKTTVLKIAPATIKHLAKGNGDDQ